jgi:stress-induced-phosphoprotein 1
MLKITAVWVLTNAEANGWPEWNVNSLRLQLGETQVLTDLQENPKAAQEHVKNAMVMERIQKLVSAGIVQVH